MQRIELDNFRVFGFPASFDLAPVTVLTGKNNSGKSSLIKAFLVLADYLEQDDQTVLRLDGPRAAKHRIGSFNDLRNWESSSNVVTLICQSRAFVFSFSFVEYQTGGPIGLREFALSIANAKGELRLAQLTDEERNLLKLEEPYHAFRLHLDQLMLETLLGPKAPWLAQAVQLRFEADQARQLHTDQEARLAMAEELLSQFPGLDIDIVANEYEHEKAQLQQLREKARQASAAAAGHEQPAPDTAYRGVVYLSDTHRLRRKLPELIAQGLGRGFVEATSLVAPSPLVQQPGNELVRNIERELFDLLAVPIHHLGVNRMHQARLYMIGEKKSEINTVAEAYLRLDAAGGSKNHFLQHWANRFELGTNARIQVYANTAINIAVQRKGKRVNLVDMGFGAGQLLTVLFQIAYLIEMQAQAGMTAVKPIILIEEPEANLHPQLQSQLAELFTETAQRYGLHFVLETHSEYLIRKLQLLVATQRCAGSDVALYYLDENSQRHIQISPDGKLSEAFGSGFFDEAGEESLALLRVQRQMKQTQSAA